MTMIMMCLGCAVLAAWLAVPIPAARSVRRRLSPTTRHSVAEDACVGGGRGLWPRLWIFLVIMIILLLLITAAGYVANARGAVVSGVILLIALTAIRLGWQYRRRRSALRFRAEIAQACAVLASYLRVGQVPSAALAIAAADCEVLREGHQAHTLGSDVVQVWRQQARRPGHAGLLQLARAWQISIETGAPMSSTLDQVAASLAADQALTQIVNSELAAARATGKLMAVLPGCGVGIGYLLGGDPARWLLAGPSGWACLLAGVLLACVGVLWIEALARQASAEV
jgi:tight adherence protein B